MAASWETGDSGALAAPHPTPWALSPHVPSTIPVTPTVVRAPRPPAGPLHRAGVWTPVVHCLQGTAGTGKHIRKLTPSPRTPAPAHPTNKSGHPGPAGGTDPPTLWKALPTTHATQGARAGLSPDAEPDGTCRGIARADHALALTFGKRAPGRAKTIAECPPRPGGQQGRSPAHLGESSLRPLRPRPRS